MTDRWYYTQNGQSHGPVSGRQLQDLAAKRLLKPQDMVWREGALRQTAVRAEIVADFRSAPQPAPVPGWLIDVAQVEAARVRRPIVKAGAAATPLWLDDVRRLEDLLTGRSPITLPPPSSLPMDWLDDIRQIEESLGGRPGPKPKTATQPPPVALASPPVARGSPPVASGSPPVTRAPGSPPAAKVSPPPSRPPTKPNPVPGDLRPPPVPSSPAAPVRPAPSPAKPTPPVKAASPPVKPPVPPVPAAPPLPVAPPLPSPQLPAPDVAGQAAASSPEVTGFDADTGQILDAAKYAKWQKDEQRRRQQELEAQPAVSVYEAFLIARTAFQEWVDSEANKPLIVAEDFEAIRRLPPIDNLLRSYQGYGSVMQDKLCKHLGFLVENRRKFYAAFG